MSPREPSRRGQVLVLGAVTLLVLVLMLMLTFNLTQAVHEKIRLQQHSDSMAFSMATIEARTLNYVAVTNRTIASAFVSMMTAHAYLSAAGLTVNILKAGQMNFIFIALEELGQCLSCCPTCCVPHCVHAGDAMKVSSDFSSNASDYADKVKRRERDFNDAIQDLSDMVKALHQGQHDAVDHTQRFLKGQGLEMLKKTNAPWSGDLPSGVGELNVSQFACALEGSKLDDQCQGGRAKSSAQSRSKVLASVANAARPDFPAGRMTAVPLQLHPSFLFNKLVEIQGNIGTAFAMMSGGCARASATAGDCMSNGNGDEGKTISAQDSGGILMQQWNDGSMLWPFGGTRLASDADGDTHQPSDAHQGSHTGFQGMQPEDVCSDGDCFINFRSDADEKDDYGQPHVYGAFSQDLRKRLNGKHGAWEITSSGSLSFELRDQRTLALVPDRDGMAVSKAMVYFHRYDTWKAGPNLFDPYWRAKLHPFTRDELQQVLEQAHFDGRDAVAGGAPVEGQRP